MTPLGLRYPMAFSYLAMCTFALGSCSNGEGDRPPPDNVINIGFDAGTIGCSQPNFPADQPDLSAVSPPIFLLTNSRSRESSTGQAQMSPGEPIESEIWVNGATRRLKLELAHAWTEDFVIYTAEEETSGNEVVHVASFTDEDDLGNYYMKLTLCGVDCDERQVVFNTHSCWEDRDSTEPCGINAPYERTLIEDGEIVRVDGTCIDLGSTPKVGSGTVFIQ